MNQSNHPNKNSRRDFLRQLSLAGSFFLFSPFIKACQRLGLVPEGETAGDAGLSPTITEIKTIETELPAVPRATAEEGVGENATVTEGPKITITPEGAILPGMATIALVMTNDRASGAVRAMDLLGDLDFRGKNVLVKPNFNSGDPPPASTDMGLMEAVLLRLKEMSAGPITVGDRSGMGSSTRIMEEKGGFALANKLGFDFLDFNELGQEAWVMVDPPGNHWTIPGSPYGQGFPFARPVYDAEAMVSLCCLKTHRYGGITMSLKNAVGMVAARPPGSNTSYMTHLHTGDMDQMIAEINLAYEPDLIIMDGVDGFISGGPARGEKVSPGLILVGRDRVAMDALGVSILKMNGSKLPKVSEAFHLRNAIQLKIGIDHPEKIRILTGDEESAAFAGQLYDYLVENWA